MLEIQGWFMASSSAALRQACANLSKAPFLYTQNLREKLTPNKLAALRHEGFCVIDGAFGEAWCRAARKEVLLAKEHGAMQLNHTHLIVPSKAPSSAGGDTKLVAKEQIYELDCSVHPELADALPHCGHDLLPSSLLKEVLHEGMPDLGLVREGDRCQQPQPMKLQLNNGHGGCFPIHTDATLMPGSADDRVVTGLLYLNEQWTAEQGGQLRLYPLLQGGAESPFAVDIAPVCDRMVLFSSTTMLHRVLPSNADTRCCVTVWLHADNASQPGSLLHNRGCLEPAELPSNPSSVEVALFLLQPMYRPFTARMILAQEWEQSILESHPGGSQETDALVASHWKNVDIIGRTFKDLLPKLDEGMRELQDARAGAVEQQLQKSKQGRLESVHPLLRTGHLPGMGGTMGTETVDGEEFFPPLPGVMEWLV